MSYPKHSTEFYKGIEIEIEYDQFAENPFENWDGCIPLIALYDRGRTDYSKGQIEKYLTDFLSYNQVKRNQTKLLNLMGDSVQGFRNDYPLEEYDRTEIIKDDFLFTWLGDCIDNMAQFCKAFGIKHYIGYSKGYSQSDWAKVFMCWTPEFEEVTGRTYKSITDEDFADGLKLYSDWAWGDVYSFFIEETGDSCSGFYGDDMENNGLMEMAREEIDSYLETKKKTKQSKLKTLIKNHVPFQNRGQILATI